MFQKLHVKKLKVVALFLSSTFSIQGAENNRYLHSKVKYCEKEISSQRSFDYSVKLINKIKSRTYGGVESLLSRIRTLDHEMLDDIFVNNRDKYGKNVDYYVLTADDKMQEIFIKRAPFSRCEARHSEDCQRLIYLDATAKVAYDVCEVCTYYLQLEDFEHMGECAYSPTPSLEEQDFLQPAKEAQSNFAEAITLLTNMIDIFSKSHSQ